LNKRPNKRNGKDAKEEVDIFEYCRMLEKKLLVSESKVVSLLLENYKLKKALNSAIQAQSSILRKLLFICLVSAITPNPNDDITPVVVQPESISQGIDNIIES
jgi:hypothetical protein